MKLHPLVVLLAPPSTSAAVGLFTVAQAVEPMAPLGSLPAWATALIKLALGSAGIGLLVWTYRTFVLPAFDLALHASLERQRERHATWLRERVLTDDFARASRRDADTAEALRAAGEALAMANATIQSISTLTANVNALPDAIGTVAALVRDLAENVSGLRAEIRSVAEIGHMHSRAGDARGLGE